MPISDNDFRTLVQDEPSLVGAHECFQRAQEQLVNHLTAFIAHEIIENKTAPIDVLFTLIALGAKSLAITASELGIIKVSNEIYARHSGNVFGGLVEQYLIQIALSKKNN